MISRKIESKILSEGMKYPVITIAGPRQSGKTTLAKKLFPDYTYVNLEQLDLRAYAHDDPKGFLDTYKPPVILDEIQNVPELLSQVQVESDRHGIDGQFVITGSQQLSLNQAVSQSLAGRTAIFTLLPYSIDEIAGYGRGYSRGEYILNGSMPRVYEKELTAESFYRDYIRTYIERDVRSLTGIRDLRKFQTFLTLLAGRTGQVVNLSAVSGEVGVSSTTLKEWLSVLEAGNIIFTLRPWYANVSKRLVKSPKIYFTDTGVVCSLLSLSDARRIESDRLFGNLFENMVILEALKSRFNQNKAADLYYLRTESGIEIDMLDVSKGRLIPYEIKSGETIVPDFFKNIGKTKKFLPELDEYAGGLIYSGDEFESYKGYKVINYRNAYGHF